MKKSRINTWFLPRIFIIALFFMVMPGFAMKVAAKTDIPITVSIDGWTYGETGSEPSVEGNTGGGAVSYQYKVSGADNSTYTGTKPTTPGSYTVKATVAETAEYNSASATAEFSILPKVLTPSLTENVITKVYDRNTTIPSTDNIVTLAGIKDGDSVSVSIESAFFETAAAGAGKTVNVEFSLDGTDKDNYILSATSLSGTVGTITPQPIVAGGITAEDKDYDGNRAATLDCSAAVVGCFLEDNVYVASATGAFADADAGAHKTVNITSIVLGGSDKDNYTLEGQPQQSSTAATIRKKALIINGITAKDKEYDGNTTATLDLSNATVSGLVENENIDFTVSGAFADAEKGIDKTVTLSGWSITVGGNNYEIDVQNSQRTTTARITGIQVCIGEGLTASPKVYDGNVTATVTGTPVLHRVIGEKNVVVSGLTVSNISAEFDEKNAGQRQVRITGGTLGGDGNENYTFMPGASTILSAEITKKDVTITGLSAANKIYDGTTTATATGTAVINGMVDGDDVTVKAGTATFGNAKAGNNKAVSFEGYGLDGNDKDNYILSAQPESVTANITPKSITGATVTLDNTSLVYNGSEQTVSVNDVALGEKHLDFDNDDYEVKGNKGKDIGSYTLTVTGINNYKDSVSLTWSITGKDMTVNANGVTTNYDGLAHGITVEVTDPSGGYTIKYGTDGQTYSLDESPTLTNAGKLTVYYKVTADNYIPVVGNAVININKIDPTITPLPAVNTLTYNGEDQELLTPGTTTGGKLVYSLTEEGTYTEAVPSKMDAGAYKVWYKVDGEGSNYNSTQAADIDVTISKKDITVGSGIKANNKTYDGTVKAELNTSNAKYIGKYARDTIVLSGEGTFEDADVGTGKTVAISIGALTLDENSAKNYNLVAVNQTSTTADIEKRNITITAKDQEIEIGESIVKNRGQVEVTTGSLAEYDEIVAVTLSDSGTTELTDNGTIECTAVTIKNTAGNDVTRNYNITFNAGKLTVIKTRPVYVAPVKKENLTYNGEEQDLITAGSVTSGGTMYYKLDNGEYSENIPKAKEAGTYTVYYKIDGDEGHSNIKETAITVTIERAAASVTAVDQEVNYGGTISTDADKYNVSGVIDTATVKHTYSVTLTPDWENKKIIPSLTIMDGEEDVTRNYNITATEGKLKVNPAALKITPKNDQGKIYGDTDPELTYTVEGLVNGDTISVIKGALTRVKGENIGEYEIKNDDLEADNYTITVTPGVKFSIEERPLRIIAKAQTIAYGLPIIKTPDQVMADNLVSGHSITQITLTPSTDQVTTTGIITPSKAVIKDSNGTDVTNNYEITYVAGTLVISNDATVNTPPTAKTLEYNGADQVLINEGTASGGTIQYALGSETAATGTFSADLPKGKNAGAYYVWYKAKGDTTHDDSAQSGPVKVIIEKKTVKIRNITAKDKVYDGTATASFDTSKAEIEGKISGDSLSVTATGTFESDGVGTDKTVNITNLILSGDSADNYKVSDSGNQETSAADITKRSATVTAVAQTVTIGGTIMQGVGYASLTGAVSGHTLGSVTLTSSSTAAETTSGTITPSDAVIMSGSTVVTGNYDITYVPGVLTVTKTSTIINPPTAKKNLVYNSKYQDLVTAGSGSGGTMQYALGSKTAATSAYTDTIPAERNAGTYYVWYRISGDSSHDDSSEKGPVTVTIAKKSLAISGITGEDKIYDGTTDADISVSLSGREAGDYLDIITTASFSSPNAGTGITINYSGLTLSGSDAGNYELTGTASGTTKGNIARRQVLVEAKNQKVKQKKSISKDISKVTLSGAVTGHKIQSVTLTSTSTRKPTNDGIITPSNAQITDGNTLVTQNYYIMYINGVLKVKKASSSGSKSGGSGGSSGGGSSSSDNDDDDSSSSSSSSSSGSSSSGSSSSGGGTFAGGYSSTYGSNTNYDELKYRIANAISTINAQRAAGGSAGITQQVITWDRGEALPYEIMKLLQDNPNITLIFKTRYNGTDYTFTIPGSAVQANPMIPWYGPLYLLLHYGQYALGAPASILGAVPTPLLPATTDATSGTYTVVKGDSLFKIAKRFNTTVDNLVKLNNIKNRDLIYPGQVLKY